MKKTVYQRYMKNKDISVVILTHNSYSTKAGAVEFVLNAYLNQVVTPYKIIVIDNGSDKYDADKLKQFCKNKSNISLYSSDLTIGGARNYGVRNVTSKYILFNDDDTIPLQNDIISRLAKYCARGAYGYGANRLWSPDLGWVKENQQRIVSLIKNGDMRCLKSFGVIPEPAIRGKNSNSLKILLKSFIGNFGLISKADFDAVGGFPEYPGYACEDDAFAFLCYLKLGKPEMFDDIELLHISHQISNQSRQEALENQQRLQKLLESNGYSEFHISRLLFKSTLPVLKRI